MTSWLDELGPVFGKELLELARRRAYWLLRIAFGLALLGIVWTSWAVHDRERGLRVLANIASFTFAQVAAYQYIAVHLLVPLVLCGAVADERRAGTLDLLFATALTDRAIVLGKLASRLFVVAIVVFSGLPALALMTFWGGFTPTMVFAVELATLVASLFAGSVAIFYSTSCQTSLRALIYSYLVLIGLYASVAYWWVSPAFVLILVFAGDSLVQVNGLSLGYAGVCLAATIGLSAWLLRAACLRLRDPATVHGRAAVHSLHRALDELPMAPAAESLERRELRRLRGEIAKHVVKVGGKRGIFDFSDRPEVGCIAALAFNFIALALPFFMAGVLLEPQRWLKMLLACAGLLFAWIVSQSVYLDRRGGFRDLILATPLESNEILRLVLRRWLPSLAPPCAAVALGQMLWLIFEPTATFFLLITEALLAANLLGLCATCMVASATRFQGFFAALFAVLAAFAAAPVLNALTARQAGPIAWTIAALIAALVAVASRRDRPVKAAARWLLTYACCIAAIVLPLTWWSNKFSPNLPAANPLTWLSPANPLDLAISPAIDRKSTSFSPSIGYAPGTLPALMACWLAMGLNLFFTWRHLVAGFDRAMDRPSTAGKPMLP